eukprot:TRINITY_DN4296_c0_g2_i1.p1 TRINITY_DN4296_c0_g2~~TRINITY_DN4296_c0_g2_i1.p1  ORF type:complete len:280 (-),score=78.97 TRINITY_DN4296_c0_g2_i1:31-870(-)
MNRPEHIAPPEIYYNEEEAKKYAQNTRIIEIQTRMSERAIELLCLPDDNVPKYLLDVGCGSGLSGEVLSRLGHYWVGMDISRSMLDVAVEREVMGDLIEGDMGQGIPFKPGTFDGAISVSALQWLCNADKKSHNPIQRIRKFFQQLYSVLNKGTRAVLQVYPEDKHQMELLSSNAMRAGFTGGWVVDYPNSTKAKKFYLVLFAGGSSQTLPSGLQGEEEEKTMIDVSGRETRKRRDKKKKSRNIKDRNWVLRKKEIQRFQGKDVRPDTKYTARKRKDRF